MVGARRNRHSAVGGCGGVFRFGRWSDLVHGRLGSQEGEIGAKTLYEVKSMPLYEVKCTWLHFGGGNFRDIFREKFRENFREIRQLKTAETERQIAIRRTNTKRTEGNINGRIIEIKT